MYANVRSFNVLRYDILRISITCSGTVRFPLLISFLDFVYIIFTVMYACYRPYMKLIVYFRYALQYSYRPNND